MAERLVCPICSQRAPRRACPSLGHAICAVCCGTGREETIACPFECEFLREARAHEKPESRERHPLPNADVDVSERFMNENERLAIVLGRLLWIAAVNTEGAVDLDVRDALDSLATTCKSAVAGLIYEARPANAIAARIFEKFQTELAKFREDVAQRVPEHAVRDRDVLGMVVFWQRMAYDRDNGRRKGRAFIESLFALLPSQAPEPDVAARVTEG